MTEKRGVRWLHLSDFHMGKKDENQKVALAYLKGAVEGFANGLEFDFVVITGDIANSGQKEEYDQFYNEFILPLKASGLIPTSRIIAVPGNHDIDCNKTIPLSWAAIGQSRQDKFFQADLDGKKTRSTRATGFSEYGSFVRSAGIFSVDPLENPAEVFSFDVRGRKLAFISSVTAFFSDWEVSDREKCPAPLHPIRNLATAIDRDTVIIALGHHPISHFLKETEDAMHTFFVERGALYIHGHEHQVVTRCGTRGLVSLGFGAAYQAREGQVGQSKYNNAFAICELRDELHVSVISWDSDHGQWRPNLNLPGDFQERSEYLNDGFALPIGSTTLQRRGKQHCTTLGGIVQNEFRCISCIWFSDIQPKHWASYLEKWDCVNKASEVFGAAAMALPSGHIQFRVKDGASQYLVRAIAGQGDVLHQEQIQQMNTELDTQGYDGVIIVTLGELSEEANKLVTLLGKRKGFRLISSEDITRKSERGFSENLKVALRSFSEKEIEGHVILLEAAIAVLVQDKIKGHWFLLLREDGTICPESDPLVLRIREELPHLKSALYKGIGAGEPLEFPNEYKFNREEYLGKSHQHFDQLRYAPLAAIGLRFEDASLSMMYIDASADLGGTTKGTMNLTRSLNELVDSLGLPKAQRDQLESQLRSRYGLNQQAEMGAARQLYQRYNNIVVLGDPGSGKTCFVKHELLAYCCPPDGQNSWYSSHLPVYLSLAEAARLYVDEADLLDICERVSSQRGISLPKAEIERAFSDGKVAFFFDGLDEVGHLDTRIALMSEIERLVAMGAPRGNRFVIASRPAAIQPVDIPDGMTFVNLKGLSDEEIRILAGRVLTCRLGFEENGKLSKEDHELIDKLLEDTRNSPGIGRISKNPLLLTLLVLIYANSGAVSAKRHLIYSQAVKTFVSVRGKQTREQKISEADLRARLGAIAVAIFKRDIAEIPKRSEVHTVLQRAMVGEGKGAGEFPAEKIDSFLQEVAEATGLLVIHRKDSRKDDDLITFMHYSFLEYYAAAGLLGMPELASLVSRIAMVPRWKDVTTLLFGVLSEQGDVTPVLEKILDGEELGEQIAGYRLLLALECASECDVPPERSQILLATHLDRCLSGGAGKFSADLRSSIADRLTNLMQGGGVQIQTVIVAGLGNSDPLIAAAFCDLVARLGMDVPLSFDVINAVQSCFLRSDPVLRTAVLYCIERCRELRTLKAMAVVKESLGGNLVERHGALKLISAAPVFYEEVEPIVIGLLDDKQDIISSLAAECLVGNGYIKGKWKFSPEILDKIIQNLDLGDPDTLLRLPGVNIKFEDWEQLLLSGKVEEVEQALKFTPFIRDAEQEVYNRLIRILSSSDNGRHTAICLDALRTNQKLMRLITIADSDLICRMLKDGERNVRIAVLKLLGVLPDDEQVLDTIKVHANSSLADPRKTFEVVEALRSLASHAQRNTRLKGEYLKLILGIIFSEAEKGFGDISRQQFFNSALSICEGLGGPAIDTYCQRLLDFAKDFKTPDSIRKHCIKAAGVLVEPTLVNAETLLALVKENDLRIREAVLSATRSFVMQCRRKVEYIRRVYSILPEMTSELCRVWAEEVKNRHENIDPPALREIRNGLVEINFLLNSYEEFSQRVQIG